MDWLTLRGKARLWLKEYRYVLLVLFLGIVLMLLPQSKAAEEGDKETPVPETVAEESLQEQLEQLLSIVQGAGKVRVLLTEAAGERVIYQTDGEENSQNTRRTDTVILSDSGRAESGLVQQILPPTYQGAVILCQGADSAAVRLALIEAVSNATGLTSDRISVLKMK
ncbi:MAG: hypothetical protein SPI15_11205 [Candidatus Faecousia sp.]|nr:hypothetical protein [Candidatus Faecousia sp.]